MYTAGFSMLILGVCLSVLLTHRFYRKTNYKEPLPPRLRAWQMVFILIASAGAILLAITRFQVAP